MNIIMLDTETANTISSPLCYDIGFAVVDLNSQTILETHSYVVKEVFEDSELMESAYYKKKIPHYIADIEKGERKVLPFCSIRAILRNTMKKYQTNYVCAHNCRFDFRSCNNTNKAYTDGYVRTFFPKNTVFLDTLDMSRKCLKTHESYREFCENNNFLCKNGANRYTAEILYRYFTNNLEFVEEHRGIEDVLIESEILFRLLELGGELEPQDYTMTKKERKRLEDERIWAILQSWATR